MSLGKCKLKQDTTTHSSERPKSSTLTKPNADKDVVGMQSGTADLEDHLAVSNKTKHTLYEMGESGPKIQMSRYKICKSGGTNVKRGDYS